MFGKYSKGIVAILGAVSTAFQTQYGTEHWVSYVVSGLSALAVILIPNQTAADKPNAIPPKG